MSLISIGKCYFMRCFGCALEAEGRRGWRGPLALRILFAGMAAQQSATRKKGKEWLILARAASPGKNTQSEVSTLRTAARCNALPGLAPRASINTSTAQKAPRTKFQISLPSLIPGPARPCQGAAIIRLEPASHRNGPPILVGFPSTVDQALVSPDSKPSLKISKDPLPM